MIYWIVRFNKWKGLFLVRLLWRSKFPSRKWQITISQQVVLNSWNFRLSLIAYTIKSSSPIERRRTFPLSYKNGLLNENLNYDRDIEESNWNRSVELNLKFNIGRMIFQYYSKFLSREKSYLKKYETVFHSYRLNPLGNIQNGLNCSTILQRFCFFILFASERSMRMKENVCDRIKNQLRVAYSTIIS